MEQPAFVLVSKVVLINGNQFLVEDFLKNITFRVKLGDHLSNKGIVKSGISKGSVLGPMKCFSFPLIHFSGLYKTRDAHALINLVVVHDVCF